MYNINISANKGSLQSWANFTIAKHRLRFYAAAELGLMPRTGFSFPLCEAELETGRAEIKPREMEFWNKDLIG